MIKSMTGYGRSEKVTPTAKCTVEIKSVSREAGSRSKMAVYTEDEHIDPVGTCIGPKGLRIQNVLNEIGSEKIDIISWSEEPGKLISSALSPAKAEMVMYPSVVKSMCQMVVQMVEMVEKAEM